MAEDPASLCFFWACPVALRYQSVFLKLCPRKMIRLESEMIFALAYQFPIMKLKMGQKDPLHKKIDEFWWGVYSLTPSSVLTLVET